MRQGLAIIARFLCFRSDRSSAQSTRRVSFVIDTFGQQGSRQCQEIHYHPTSTMADDLKRKRPLTPDSPPRLVSRDLYASIRRRHQWQGQRVARLKEIEQQQQQQLQLRQQLHVQAQSSHRVLSATTARDQHVDHSLGTE
jgi:hypothetical protein